MRLGTMPGFIGTVNERGWLQFTPRVHDLMRTRLQRLKPGTPVEVTLTRWRQTRSSQANRYYWGQVIPPLAAHCRYTRQHMHEVLAMRVLRIEDDPITGAPRRRSTPDTDTQDFADYVDRCIAFAAGLGIVIPAPEPREVQP